MTKEEVKKKLLWGLNEQRKIFGVPKDDPAYETAKKFAVDVADTGAEVMFALNDGKKIFELCTLNEDAFISAMADIFFSYEVISRYSWDELIAKVQLKIMQREEEAKKK